VLYLLFRPTVSSKSLLLKSLMFLLTNTSRPVMQIII